MYLLRTIGLVMVSRESHCKVRHRGQLICSFRNDQSIALSIDSHNRYVRDCYRLVVSESLQNFKLVPSDQIASRENNHSALAIWQQLGIVILLDKKGNHNPLIKQIDFIQVGFKS